jgi:hypothetical protein
MMGGAALYTQADLGDNGGSRIFGSIPLTRGYYKKCVHPCMYPMKKRKYQIPYLARLSWRY